MTVAGQAAVTYTYGNADRLASVTQGSNVVTVTYDTDLQRFISEDPLGPLGPDTNLYVYVRNSPMRWNDPWGRAPGDPYPTLDEAGRQAVCYYNAWSNKKREEFGGYVYRGSDGKYTYSPHQEGWEPAW